MRKNSLLSSVAIIVVTFANYTNAAIELGEPIHSSALITKQTSLSTSNTPQRKEVYLINIKLTPQ